MEISGSVFAPDTLQPCCFLAILFPIIFGMVSKTYQGSQPLVAELLWALVHGPDAVLILSSPMHCSQYAELTHTVRAASLAVFPPGKRWDEQPAVSVDKHLWTCISWTDCPASFPRTQQWWDTSSSAQCLQGFTLQPRLRSESHQQWWELLPPAWPLPGLKSSQGLWLGKTPHISSALGTALLLLAHGWRTARGTREPMLTRPRHSVLATHGSHSSAVPPTLCLYLKQHSSNTLRKSPGLRLSCPAPKQGILLEWSRWEKTSCVPLVSPQH